MKRTLLSLLLLLTFGFGLVAGPHPCHEAAAAEGAEKAVRGVPHVVSGIDHIPLA
jgi:hypothetical protein